MSLIGSKLNPTSLIQYTTKFGDSRTHSSSSWGRMEVRAGVLRRRLGGPCRKAANTVNPRITLMDFCLSAAVLCGTSIEAFISLQVYSYVPLIQQRKDGADLKSPMAPFLLQAVLAEMAWESAAGETQYKSQDGSIDDDPSLRTPDTLARELQASRTGRSQRQDLASERLER